MSTILSRTQRELIREAGSILKDCMDSLSKEMKAGVSTKALERKAEGFIASKDAKAAFRGYRGFPSGICSSRNEVVVHGIPRKDEILEKGDIISLDIGVKYRGYFADCARTFAVGKISEEAKRLISVTKKSLDKGIEMAKSGNRVQDISWAIQSFVESNGFNVVRAFVGHGIGAKIHEEPEVPNFGRPNKGMVLEDGMVLAIEPMVNAGTSDVRILDDGWTAVTKDGRLSAHFEDTVIINGEKAEIVT
ncbi:MAG: type I methionyl aminopeptidase [Candidatus Omnitrophota bacterium]